MSLLRGCQFEAKLKRGRFTISSDWQPSLYSGNLNPLFKRNEDISSGFTRQNTLGLAALFREFYVRSAIMKARRP